MEEAQKAVREASTVISVDGYSLLQQSKLPWVPPVLADWLSRDIDREDEQELLLLERWVEQAEGVDVRDLSVFSPRMQQPYQVTAEDFVAEIPAFWSLQFVKAALEPYGLALPHSSTISESELSEELQVVRSEYFYTLSMTDHIGWNIPHLLSAQHGTWRDWILGCTFLTADGQICRSGSRVAKNVAGFDFHKFLIGSRSAFVLPLNFTLRVVPIAAVQKPNIRISRHYMRQYNDPSGGWVIHRVREGDFASACRHNLCRSTIFDHSSNTIYRYLPQETLIPRYPGDWVLRIGGVPSPEFTDTESWVIRRAKQLFDPTNKLNPGILGIV